MRRGIKIDEHEVEKGELYALFPALEKYNFSTRGGLQLRRKRTKLVSGYTLVVDGFPLHFQPLDMILDCLSRSARKKVLKEFL